MYHRMLLCPIVVVCLLLSMQVSSGQVFGGPSAVQPAGRKALWEEKLKRGRRPCMVLSPVREPNKPALQIPRTHVNASMRHYLHRTHPATSIKLLMPRWTPQSDGKPASLNGSFNV